MPNLGLRNKLISASILTGGFWVAFDGTEDTIDFSTSFNNIFDASDYSMSAWIYPTDNNGTIFSTGHISLGNTVYLRFNYHTNTKIRVTFDGNALSSDADILTTNSWQQVGFSYDHGASPSVRLYVNGSEVKNGSFTSSAVDDTNARIGALAESVSSSGFESRIANVAMFDDVVSASEMQDLASVHSYDATSIGNCVGWWRMGAGTEAGEGSTIYDMSTNSNNGTLTDNAVIESGTSI